MKNAVNKILAILVFALLAQLPAFAQELNCQVEINTQQIQTNDKKIYESLKQQVVEFMNNRKWTNDQFQNQERIDCSILITITERTGNDAFKASIQVSSRRPAYKTTYNSSLLNISDQDFAFNYIEFQTLDFNDNSYSNNLTSVLAFYAYVIIGLDYDSFSLNGGTSFFQKAQNVVNSAQNSSAIGWKASEKLRNRYWLVENLLNPAFVPIRETYYSYHRQGMDILASNKEVGRANIANGLSKLQEVHKSKPGSYLMQLFFVAKSMELVSLFSEGDMTQRNNVFNILSVIDPANTSKYQKIIQN